MFYPLPDPDPDPVSADKSWNIYENQGTMQNEILFTHASF